MLTLPRNEVSQREFSVLDQTALYKTIGDAVRKAREKRGLTQRELGSQVSLTRTSITNIEWGRQKLLVHTLVDLAHALSVPVTELLGDVAFHNPIEELDELIKTRPRIEQEWIKKTLGPKRKG